MMGSLLGGRTEIGNDTTWTHAFLDDDWSNAPNWLLGPDQFREICMPDIAAQASMFDRAIFHLDGPGSARHIDALLEIPSIHAVQYTPGAGAPSALPWIEMFRKIQDSGRSVLIICPPEEILELCDQLRPEGLAFLIADPPPAAELDELWKQFNRRFGSEA